MTNGDYYPGILLLQLIMIGCPIFKYVAVTGLTDQVPG